jgi:hypothetical protein
MSEKLFKFLLSELACLRIRCQQCGGVAEIPSAKFTTPQRGLRCPGCGNAFVQQQNANAADLITALGQAIEALRVAGLDPEFVIPDRPE